MADKVIPRIENWYIQTSQFGRTIVGQVYGHPDAEDGSVIQTSRLRNMSEQVCTPREGVTIFTLNSTYLLGQPLENQ